MRSIYRYLWILVIVSAVNALVMAQTAELYMFGTIFGLGWLKDYAGRAFVFSLLVCVGAAVAYGTPWVTPIILDKASKQVKLVAIITTGGARMKGFLKKVAWDLTIVIVLVVVMAFGLRLNPNMFRMRIIVIAILVLLLVAGAVVVMATMRTRQYRSEATACKEERE